MHVSHLTALFDENRFLWSQIFVLTIAITNNSRCRRDQQNMSRGGTIRTLLHLIYTFHLHSFHGCVSLYGLDKSAHFPSPIGSFPPDSLFKQSHNAAKYSIVTFPPFLKIIYEYYAMYIPKCIGHSLSS